MAYAWRQRLRLAWAEHGLERIATTREALGALESLRTAQGDGSAGAAAFSSWTLDYYWLVARLLAAAEPAPDDVALAFEVTERMRARQLLDAMDRLPFAGPAAAARVASLSEVEAGLGGDEALLSFVIGVERTFHGEPSSGGRLLVVTRQGTRVVRVPDRVRLHAAVPIVRGLVERQSAIDESVGVRLYDLLLREALSVLPAGVTRLIIVADGPLHHLPWPALTPAAGRAPIADTHDLVLAPSATVWLRLRTRTRAPRAGTVLALADPLDARVSGPPAEERDWSIERQQLGPLPFARREGRAAVARLGPGAACSSGRRRPNRRSSKRTQRPTRCCTSRATRS